MLSRRLVVVIVLWACVGLSAPSSALAAKDYRASQYDVRLVVEPGGSMVVTETIHFVFGPDAFSSVSRGLPSRRIDGLRILWVGMDGRACAPGDEPGQYEIEKQDDSGRRIVWHFDKTTASAHTFTLTYRVEGVVQHSATADLLEWRALPVRHEYGITCATVEMTYPHGIALADLPVADPAPAAAWSGSGPVRFERCGFARDDSWLVRLALAPRSIAPTPPDWQRRARQAQRKLPLFLGLAGMILVAGMGAFGIFGLNHRSFVPRDSEARRHDAPGDLPLTLGWALAQNGRTTWHTALAAILDMARRRVVSIDEIPAGVLRRRDFALTPAGNAAPLGPVERTLYDLLFTTKSGPRSTVKFSELAKVFGSASRWKRVTRAVKAGLQAAGLIDAQRTHTRVRATGVAVGVIVLGVLGLIAAVPFVREYGGAALMPGAAAIAAGLVGLVIAQNITPLTDDAIRRSRQWQAYGRHVKDLSKAGSAAAVTPDVLDRTLPSAVAFGVGTAWAKALLKQGLATGPTWLRALPHEGSGAGHMQAAIAMLSAGHLAAHAVDHASAGGVASGAAGGGSSSAG